MCPDRPPCAASPPAVGPRSDPRFATSLAHGLALIEAFADGPRGLTNAELARRTGLSRASVSRLTTTLVQRRIVDTDRDSGRYRLGVGAVTLVYPLLACFGIRRLARLAMKQFSDSLGATVSIGVRDRHRVVYLESIPGPAPIAFRPDVGAPLPLLQSAMGRAWLCSATPAVRRLALADLRQRDPRLLARWRPQLRTAMADFEQHGFCLSRGDWIADVHAVAVPLAPLPDGERLLLNCGVAARRLRRGDLEGRIARQLRALARRIDSERERHPEAVWPTPGRTRGAAPVSGEWRGAEAAVPLAGGADRAFARTLASGIDLLSAFSPLEPWLGNASLAQRVERSPQTVARLTHTLTALGYLHRDAASARYRLGPSALSLAYPMLSNLRIRALARPSLQALAKAVGGAASIGLRHDIAMVYVETAWQADDRLLPPDIGAPMPMLDTAMGRAWLCQAREAERVAVLHRLRLHDPAGHGRYTPRLAEWRRAFAAQGWISSRDFRPEVEAFALPLGVRCDGLEFVVNCGVLAPRPLAAARVREIVPALQEAAFQIRNALGAATRAGTLESGP